jgi:RimJ/RimL family protein N-acetyltransferase
MDDNSKVNSPIIKVRWAKVGLGPFLPEHREIYYRVYRQDPETAIYANGTFELPPPSALNQNQPGGENSKEVIFTIFELEGLQMIGESLLMQIDLLHGTATLGITIGDKAYWGKGYGT